MCLHVVCDSIRLRCRPTQSKWILPLRIGCSCTIRRHSIVIAGVCQSASLTGNADRPPSVAFCLAIPTADTSNRNLLALGLRKGRRRRSVQHRLSLELCSVALVFGRRPDMVHHRSFRAQRAGLIDIRTRQGVLIRYKERRAGNPEAKREAGVPRCNVHF